ncbi:hypothetical protein Lesp02_60510 [Lentzea sp. NBRC 105346]|nr:hypothetical protein Lesp02_60510 [Lentzea sp. NBRC 105346]
MVQADSIDTVTVHQPHRTWPLLLLALVLFAAVGGIWGWQTLQAPSVPLTASISYTPAVGWVVPFRDDSPLPYVAQPSNGIPGRAASLSITVHGLTDEAVVLEGIRLETVARRAPTPGAFLWSGRLCPCDVVPIRMFAADLDGLDPTLKFFAGENNEADFPYKVTRSAPEKIVVNVATYSDEFEWRLHLTWSSGTKQGSLVIDDNGRPFRLTAMEGSKIFCPDPKLNDMSKRTQWVRTTKETCDLNS